MTPEERLQEAAELNRQSYQQKASEQNNQEQNFYAGFDAATGLAKLRSSDGSIFYGSAETNGTLGTGDAIRLRQGGIVAGYDAMPRTRQVVTAQTTTQNLLNDSAILYLIQREFDSAISCTCPVWVFANLDFRQVCTSHEVGDDIHIYSSLEEMQAENKNFVRIYRGGYYPLPTNPYIEENAASGSTTRRNVFTWGDSLGSGGYLNGELTNYATSASDFFKGVWRTVDFFITESTTFTLIGSASTSLVVDNDVQSVIGVDKLVTYTDASASDYFTHYDYTVDSLSLNYTVTLEPGYHYFSYGFVGFGSPPNFDSSTSRNISTYSINFSFTGTPTEAEIRPKINTFYVRTKNSLEAIKLLELREMDAYMAYLTKQKDKTYVDIKCGNPTADPEDVETFSIWCKIHRFTIEGVNVTHEISDTHDPDSPILSETDNWQNDWVISFNPTTDLPEDTSGSPCARSNKNTGTNYIKHKDQILFVDLDEIVGERPIKDLIKSEQVLTYIKVRKVTEFTGEAGVEDDTCTIDSEVTKPITIKAITSGAGVADNIKVLAISPLLAAK